MDTYQSAQLKQQLDADGFKTQITSVDRLDNIQGTNTKVCLPYTFLKTCIYEKKIEIYNKCDLLTEELIGLEKEPDGHINHPENGAFGSKDQADALCGSLYNASLNIEQYAFDYGETLDAIVKVSSASTVEQEKEQIKVAFEQELQKLLDPKQKQLNKTSSNSNNNNEEKKEPVKSPYLDFGMGPAQVYQPGYLQNGIIY